ERLVICRRQSSAFAAGITDRRREKARTAALLFDRYRREGDDDKRDSFYPKPRAFQSKLVVFPYCRFGRGKAPLWHSFLAGRENTVRYDDLVQCNTLDAIGGKVDHSA